MERLLLHMTRTTVLITATGGCPSELARVPPVKYSSEASLMLCRITKARTREMWGCSLLTQFYAGALYGKKVQVSRIVGLKQSERFAPRIEVSQRRTRVQEGFNAFLSGQTTRLSVLTVCLFHFLPFPF